MRTSSIIIECSRIGCAVAAALIFPAILLAQEVGPPLPPPKPSESTTAIFNPCAPGRTFNASQLSAAHRQTASEACRALGGSSDWAGYCTSIGQSPEGALCDEIDQGTVQTGDCGAAARQRGQATVNCTCACKQGRDAVADYVVEMLELIQVDPELASQILE